MPTKLHGTQTPRIIPMTKKLYEVVKNIFLQERWPLLFGQVGSNNKV